MQAVDAANISSSPAVRTGWEALDAFVEGGGFPCGKLTLLESAQGLGALTLWLESSALLTRQGRRVAWLNGASDDHEHFRLHPPTAHHRGVDLQNLFLVDTPNRQKRAWILQELLASNLFSLVGCDLGDAHLPLRECRSLLMQARRSGAAVVLFSRNRGSPAVRSLASLVLSFSTLGIEITRAAHRPIPHSLQRRDRHVDFIIGSKSNSHASLAGRSSSLEHDDGNVDRALARPRSYFGFND